VAVRRDGAPVVVSLRAAGLGDLLTAVPALRAIRDRFPEHVHVLAAPQPLWPIAELTGAVDAYVPARHATCALHQQLSAPVDVAVNLHGCGPESHRALLACEPATLVSFRNSAVPLSSDGPRWYAQEHEVARWCRLLRAYGISADPRRLDLTVPDDSPTEPVQRATGATLLHPGAASPSRRWPVTRWAALARIVRSDGLPVVVTAGPGERTLAEAVADLGGPGIDVVDCSDEVTTLVRVVAASARVVCGDTGVAHLATALRTPSVVLCGPTSPARWGPPVERPWHVALWAGHVGDPHGARPDPGLLELTVSDVSAALATLPAAPRARRLDYASSR